MVWRHGRRAIAAAVACAIAPLASASVAVPAASAPLPARTQLASVSSPAPTAATPSGPVASPSIRFALVATVSGHYGAYSPWSPAAPWIAYSDDAGIAVLDVTHTPADPRRVHVGIDTDCTWSPDGAWLLVRTPSRTPGAQGAALIAVPLSGGAETTVADDILISDFAWAADGKIYYWDYDTPKPHAVTPPAAWQRGVHAPLSMRPQLVFVFGGGAPAAHLFDVRDGVASTRALTALAGLPRSILQADGFPDGRLLVRQSAAMDEHGVNRIFDRAGAQIAVVRASVPGGDFAATSVSVDGRFVAGERVEDAGDGILAATLHFVAVDGAWSTRVDGVEWGTQPRLSRVGAWLAFTDAEGRAHIGSWTRLR